jgi:hypothetical protein
MIRRANDLLGIKRSQRSRYFWLFRTASEGFEGALVEGLRRETGFFIEYVEYLFEHKADSIPRDMKLDFLRLLCQHRKEGVLPAIQKYEFPLEDAETVIREHEKEGSGVVKEALVYLLEKKGQVREAVALRTDIFVS